MFHPQSMYIMGNIDETKTSCSTKKSQRRIWYYICSHFHGILCFCLLFLCLLANHDNDQFFQLRKLIMCNGHAITLALVVGPTWNFICGFPLCLKAIASPTSFFASTILVVGRFVKMEFWMQWVTMVNVMTIITMLTFFIIWIYGFGCKCLKPNLFGHYFMGWPSQVQHTTPWPSYFVEKDGESPNWLAFDSSFK